MSFLKYLLPLILITAITSCKDDENGSLYDPTITTSEDIKTEIGKFKLGFGNYATIIDEASADAHLDYGITQYASFYNAIPTLKNIVEEKAYSSNWPADYPTAMAEEERLLAVEYLTVIDSLSEATGIYLENIQALKRRNGQEYLYLYNSCKAFIDELEFATTSYADISKKYTKLKRSTLVPELAYFQMHKRKADVDFFLEHGVNIEHVWDFYDATFENYINRTNMQQLAYDSLYISSTLAKVNSLENSQEIYDSLFYAKSYNPLEYNHTSYSTLNNFATALPFVFKAETYINLMYNYIVLLEQDVDSVKRNVSAIQEKRLETTTQTQFLSAFNTFYPAKAASLQTAFDFPVIINKLLRWNDEYTEMVSKTDLLYSSYQNADTITDSNDIAAINEIENTSSALLETHISEKYSDYFSASYNDLLDVYNETSTGGKLTYLVHLLE